MALPRRLALPLHLRKRPGPLLLPAARLSWSSAGRLHPGRPRPRIPNRKILRPELHDQLRPPDFPHRLLARAADEKYLAWNRREPAKDRHINTARPARLIA